jgi:putative transposase
MRFAFIAKHRHVWPLEWMCSALEVSRSGFHAWLTRAPSARALADAALTPVIERSFKASDRTYGARRVWRDVLAEGVACGLHKVERLMRQSALRARPRRRGLPKDRAEREAAVAANVLDRAFEGEADQKPVRWTGFPPNGPNQKWIADFTYVWTAEGWLYVAAVIDLFSRRVVGWSMSATMTAQLVTDALVMALWRRGRVEMLLHHSDQGSQYTSAQFQDLLKAHGINCSMSKLGDVWEFKPIRASGSNDPVDRSKAQNAAMESFFSSLKIERIRGRVYRTRDEARADVFDYIERFYNPKRRHSTLGYLSPMDFEKQAMQA